MIGDWEDFSPALSHPKGNVRNVANADTNASRSKSEIRWQSLIKEIFKTLRVTLLPRWLTST
ncbi:MAG: hypothetical protein ACYTXY_04695 [Nostoc sp.]